jgi:hypothetical protein
MLLEIIFLLKSYIMVLVSKNIKHIKVVVEIFCLLKNKGRKFFLAEISQNA